MNVSLTDVNRNTLGLADIDLFTQSRLGQFNTKASTTYILVEILQCFHVGSIVMASRRSFENLYRHNCLIKNG